MSTGQRLAEPLHVFRRVVANGDLRKLELAWAASNLANRASAIAVAVYAYESGGAGAVGLILFVRFTVAAAAAPWLGLLADRRARRQVLVASQLCGCLILGAMAALASLHTGQLAVYLLSVLIAVVEPTFRSAQAALTPSLVQLPEELTAANVIASGVESVGLFAGPALGALFLVIASSGGVFAATSGLMLVAATLVARIGLAGEPSRRRGEAHLRALLAGWRTIVSRPGLRVVIGLYSAQTLVAGMVNVLVVVLAIDLLDLGTAWVGWFAGTVGIGALVGILLVAGVAGRERLSGYFAVGLLLWGVPLILVAAWPEAGAMLVLLALVGIGNTLVDVTGVTLMQRAAPDELLGRVFGAWETLVFLTMGLGSLLAPLLVSTLGTRGAVLVAGSILPIMLALLGRPLVSVDRALVAPRHQVALLRGVSIFAPLAPPELERLAKALVEIRTDVGSPVFSEGDPGDRFYVIADGSAAVEMGGRQVRVLGPGDFFGEIALLRDVPRTATVRAQTALRLYALDRDTFVATVTGHPASAEAAGSIVAARPPAPFGR